MQFFSLAINSCKAFLLQQTDALLQVLILQSCNHANIFGINCIIVNINYTII